MAKKRYTEEVKRVLSVLESELSKREWLVGGRATIADFSFWQWNAGLGFVMKDAEDFDFEKQYPSVYA